MEKLSLLIFLTCWLTEVELLSWDSFKSDAHPMFVVWLYLISNGGEGVQGLHCLIRELDHCRRLHLLAEMECTCSVFSLLMVGILPSVQPWDSS